MSECRIQACSLASQTWSAQEISPDCSGSRHAVHVCFQDAGSLASQKSGAELGENRPLTVENMQCMFGYMGDEQDASSFRRQTQNIPHCMHLGKL